MRRWKVILAYDGTPFHGWQVQPGLATVQGTLAGAICQITGEKVLPQGSGRTDTGVHALAQVASFSLAAPIPPDNLHRALNRALPPSIRILVADHAAEGFHARHSALRKTYEYRVFPRVPPDQVTNRANRVPERICPPLLAPYVWDCPFAFDLFAANAAAEHVLGLHDFSSFAASDPDLSSRASDTEPPSNVREITSTRWAEEGGLLVYRVTGTGFLHHMVRNLVGTFAECAAGRLTAQAVPGILAARDRRVAGPTAPARGLFLHHVEY